MVDGSSFAPVAQSFVGLRCAWGVEKTRGLKIFLQEVLNVDFEPRFHDAQ